VVTKLLEKFAAFIFKAEVSQVGSRQEMKKGLAKPGCGGCKSDQPQSQIMKRGVPNMTYHKIRFHKAKF